jgi:bifunctional non-homologous end joining protein LigD
MVGTGYDDELLRDLGKKLRKIEKDDPPFSKDSLPKKNVHWVKPKLVGQVGFTEWTGDGKLRHPRFKGLRRDKKPKDRRARKTMKIGGHKIDISHKDKIFFPKAKITKGDVVDYFRRVAKVMLPHTRGRPLAMRRHPDGIEGEGFFQKEVPDYFPRWIKRVSAPRKGGGKVDNVVCDNAATLVYLANQACFTPHVWLSRRDKLDCPDQLIFDLDPPGKKFALVRFAAKALHDLFDELGLRAFVKTTGSRGLHVIVPLDRKQDFDTARQFAQDVARVLAQRHPKRLTVEARKNKRRGRLYLDTGRNSYAQHAVAAYAVRAIEGAPIATPLSWKELADNKVNAQSFNMKNIFQRLSRKSDPWRNLRRSVRAFKTARKQLETIMKEELNK